MSVHGRAGRAKKWFEGVWCDTNGLQWRLNLSRVVLSGSLSHLPPEAFKVEKSRARFKIHSLALRAGMTACMIFVALMSFTVGAGFASDQSLQLAHEKSPVENRAL